MTSWTCTPLTLEDARGLVDRYVTHYNEVRLHSAIGYVTPKDKLEGREADIFAQRDRKLAEARKQRRAARQQARDKAVDDSCGDRKVDGPVGGYGSAGKQPERRPGGQDRRAGVLLGRPSFPSSGLASKR